MKKLMWAGAAVLILSVFAALFISNKPKNREYTAEEFLFDTVCTVTAYGSEAEAAVTAAFDRLSEIHLATDFYSENSEVAKINSAKGGEEITVSPDLCQMLDTALRVGRDSKGAFDITVASVTKLWDFKNQGSVPTKAQIDSGLQCVGIDKLTFNKGKSALIKSCDEVKIDLGGVAKGYAGDVAIQVIKEFDVQGAIVDLGGNITCFGENPNSRDGGWRIGIQKPFAPTGEYGEIVEVAGGAVVTGGTYQRYFEKDGRLYHHIIDPQTGYPADSEYSSVTIVSQSGLESDCLATACFVLGEDEGQALAEKYGADIYFN